MFLCRRSQWSGAKALAKLIKPRKESSRERGGDRDKEAHREREGAKSVPDIPLPATPPILLPETPPPVSLRTGSDSLGGSNHSNPSSSSRQAPALTPISKGKLSAHRNCSDGLFLIQEVFFSFVFLNNVEAKRVQEDRIRSEPP